ncbi:nicotinamide riboside transporter PnuC [Parvibium lacunae]|uniref:nicotinamide riboside transporter PnuC n=1 Tax=Parvibium lacunae TaxID=1888893 RepID=UPI001314E5B8|nr:nicotinamide riboside transporter PnuC [Parvibium lacunae]
MEFFANLTTSLSIFLAAKNKIHTWWTGILGSIVFCFLFYQSKLYADIVLQIFFIGSSVIGWIFWQRQKIYTDILVMRARVFSILIAISTLLSIIHGYLLHQFTDAYAPYADSFILMFSVLAQILMVKKYLQAWFCWIAINLIAIPLYMSKDLYLTSGLYVFYLINAIFGIRNWQNIYRNKVTCNIAAV